MPKPCLGNASTVATTREMIWLGTSSEVRSPPAIPVNASRTLSSLSTKAGSDAVDAGAGPAAAWAIGCWITEDALAGTGAGAVEATLGDGLAGDSAGCMPRCTRYTPAATTATTTIMAAIQPPYEVCLILRFTMLPVSLVR
ncbi:hypothetical protein GCM10007901_32450 [Dyella acidisoli]|uniref:Uncharacterized protein n=1 Tax=Dyella acidisoli TaxID=1867834 RepID=A0ABQ5XVD7_9GAMM|nr:hypothetical protein GCM10007901_32450 [Dyella acidisoli]